MQFQPMPVFATQQNQQHQMFAAQQQQPPPFQQQQQYQQQPAAPYYPFPQQQPQQFMLQSQQTGTTTMIGPNGQPPPFYGTLPQQLQNAPSSLPQQQPVYFSPQQAPPPPQQQQQQQQVYCQLPNGTFQLISFPGQAQQTQPYFMASSAGATAPSAAPTGAQVPSQNQQSFFVMMPSPGTSSGSPNQLQQGGTFGGNSSTSSGPHVHHLSTGALSPGAAPAGGGSVAWQPQHQQAYNTMMTGGTSGSLFVVPGSAAMSPQSSLGAFPQLVVGGSPSGMHGGNPLMMPLNTSAHSLPNNPGSASQTANSSMSTRPPTDVNTWGYAVVDQYHPSLQRLPVPPSVVSKTRGTVTYNNDVQSSSTKPCASTVCLKFTTRSAPLSESCPLEEHCPTFHIERSYLEAARAVSEPLCCGLHNDYFSQEMLASGCAPHLAQQRFILVLEDRAEIELSPVQLCLTVGLDQLTHRGPAPSSGSLTSTRVINMRKQVCRLHFEGKCKWTKDCGHVHLCRELHRYLTLFHFPSLMFLLTTEQNRERIEAKLKEEHPLGDFVKSRCVLPLITHMIEGGRVVALEALFASGAVGTAEQFKAAEALGVRLPTADGDGVVLCNIVQVHPKILRLVNPKSSTEDPSQQQQHGATSFGNNSSSEDPRHSSNSSSRGQNPLSLEPHEEDENAALIAMQVAEAGITSPTRMEGRSLTMPSFSPSASATSDIRKSPQTTTTGTS